MIVSGLELKNKISIIFNNKNNLKDGSLIVEVMENAKLRKSINKVSKEIDIEKFLSTETKFLKSISEARISLKENSVSINKNKVSQNTKVTKLDLLNDKYILLQRGRKNYHLVIVK